MKFVYVDETGDKGQSDVFVMTGLLIDAYSLRKYTASFDRMLTAFLAKHPKSPRELKTKIFINGDKGWNKVDAEERKKFLAEVCDLAAECARVFAVVNWDHAREHERKSEFCFEVGNEARNPPRRGHVPMKY
jgi:Protein of unknown function (DUF3800)